MPDLLVPNPHALPASVVIDRLASEARCGLGERDAGDRLLRYGRNDLPEHPADGLVQLLVRQVAQPLIFVLMGAAIASAALGHWIDAAVIVGVVVANAIVGAVQERRAGQAVAALAKLVARHASVVRDGQPRSVDAGSIVPGDVLLLEPGDRVPADARMIEEHGLLVDESLLTGEAMTVTKQEAGALSVDTLLPDRVNVVHGGTLVTAGTARAVVTATGAGTEMGRISGLIATADPTSTPLARKVAKFSRTLTWVILVLAAVTFVLAIVRGYSALDGFLAAVALAVAAIPEGMPAIMTIALAAGATRMVKKNAIVRHLPAVETLGSATVVCTDKTGTLTRNEMTVTELYVGDRIDAEGSGYAPTGRFLQHGAVIDPLPLRGKQLLEAGLLCCDARIFRGEDGDWKLEGDPTEGALVAAAVRAGLDRRTVMGQHPRIDELPFDSRRRYMVTLHAAEACDDAARLIVKGAPEAVLGMCAAASWPAQAAADESLHHQLGAVAAQMADRGRRVLAVAELAVSNDVRAIGDAGPLRQLTLLGLVGLEDPPRAEARAAVDACHQAGIRVVMVTGDHPGTARAIAAATGITPAQAGEDVVTGHDFERLADVELVDRAASTSIFARVSPEHKLRLVRMLQTQGEVVAMTGDGVNDAPALRRADIGIAMGRNGTDVSREAADMVLRDDNFATIEAAVEEGRRVYDNIIKSIVFILPTSIGESLLILVAIMFGLTLPILPVQVLWINLVTTVALDLALSVEQLEPGSMHRPPRRAEEPVLGALAMQRIGLVSIFMVAAGLAVFYWEQSRGAPIEEIRTSVATTIVLIEACYLLSCRSLRRSMWAIGWISNPFVWIGITLVLLLQAAWVWLPALNSLFDTAPLSLEQVLAALLIAVLVLPVIAIDKWIRSRFEAGRAR